MSEVAPSGQGETCITDEEINAALAHGFGEQIADEISGQNVTGKVKWRERWYGSEPEKGSAITDERGNLVAYFGGDEATHAAVTKIVAQHNAALAAAPAPSGQGVSGEVTKADRDLYVRLHPDMCSLIYNGDFDQNSEMRAIVAFREAAALATPAPSCAPASGVTVPEGEKIARAIKATEYKYFGDYEMSDDQREAVDVLVRVAQHYANTKPAALSTPSATPGEDHEIIARELLKGAVMRRDGTGASITKHDREGVVDVGAAVDAIIVAIQMRITATLGTLDPATVERLQEACRDMIGQAFDHYTARNGRRMSIEGDDGEKCWVVPFEAFEDVRRALATDPHQHGGKGA